MANGWMGGRLLGGEWMTVVSRQTKYDACLFCSAHSGMYAIVPTESSGPSVRPSACPYVYTVAVTRQADPGDGG